jgi:hypothetical protein
MGLAEALLITPKCISRAGGGDGEDDPPSPLSSSLTSRATEGELKSIRAIVKSGRGLLDLVNNLLVGLAPFTTSQNGCHRTVVTNGLLQNGCCRTICYRTVVSERLLQNGYSAVKTRFN